MLFWGIFQEMTTSRGGGKPVKGCFFGFFSFFLCVFFFFFFFLLCAIEISTWLPTLLIKNKFRPMKHFHIYFSNCHILYNTTNYID